MPRTTLKRLRIHILGYVPYTTVWAILLYRYEVNRERLKNEFPEFLPQAVWGTFAAFTVFGLVQLFSQLPLPRPCGMYGPSLYWLGELTYIVLSFAAKANFGLVILYEVLATDYYDNLLYIQRVDVCN